MSGALAALLFSGVPGVFTSSLVGESEASPALWSVLNDGTYTSNTESLGVWVTPATSAVAALYQVKVDATSGAFTTGTTGTWLDCSSNQSWTKILGSVTFTVSFREKASGIVRKTQTGIVLQGT